MNGGQAQLAGGVGRALSLWLTDSGPRAYLLPCDVRRFLELHSNPKFLRERVQEAVGRCCLPPHPLQVRAGNIRDSKEHLFPVEYRAEGYVERIQFS